MDRSVPSVRQKRKLRARLIRLAALLVCVYPLYVLLGLFGGRFFMYPGASFMPLLPDPDVRPSEVLELDTDAGTSFAWFYEPAGRAPAPLVVFFHGNAELVSHNAAIAERYQAEGYAVLMPEYRGYHGCDGSPRADAIVSDIVRFIDVARSKDSVDNRRLIYHGFSIGGAVAGATASELPPDVLVLSSTFSAMGSMFKRYGLPPFVAPDPYPTKRTVEGLSCPVLVTHGNLDVIVPTREGRKLGQITRAEYFEHDGGHNDALTREMVWDVILPFVRSVVPPPPPQPEGAG